MSEFRKRLSAVFTTSASTADYSQDYTPSTSSSFIHRDIFSPTKPSSSAPGGPAVQQGSSSSLPDDLSEEESKSSSNVTRRRKPSLAKDESSSFTSPSKLDRWNKKLEQYPFLGFLEKRTGLRKVYIASFLLGLFALLVFRGIGMSVITILVGFIYPLHMSLKTIENCTSLFEEISGENRHKHTEEQIKEKRGEIVGQLRKWLVYWVVYGLFNILESFSDFSLSWLPIYHPLKLVFLLWCFLPQYQGSQLVFDIVVRPVLLRHEATIEQGVETAQQAAKFSVNRVGRVVRAKSIQLTQAIQKTGEQLLTTSSSSSSEPSPSSRNQKDAIAAANSFSNSIMHDAIHEGHEGEHYIAE